MSGGLVVDLSPRYILKPACKSHWCEAFLDARSTWCGPKLIDLPSCKATQLKSGFYMVCIKPQPLHVSATALVICRICSAYTGLDYKTVPRFGELCFCCCLPLRPKLACSILVTWGPPYTGSLYNDLIGWERSKGLNPPFAYCKRVRVTKYKNKWTRSCQSCCVKGTKRNAILQWSEPSHPVI